MAHARTVSGLSICYLKTKINIETTIKNNLIFDNKSPL